MKVEFYYTQIKGITLLYFPFKQKKKDIIFSSSTPFYFRTIFVGLKHPATKKSQPNNILKQNDVKYILKLHKTKNDYLHII